MQHRRAFDLSWDVLAGRGVPVACAAITLMLGMPFCHAEFSLWPHMGSLILAGVVFLAVGAFSHAAAVTSRRDALLLLLLCCSISFLLEWIGTHGRFPFMGPYSYHPELGPMLGGRIPLFIPLAWFILATAPLVLLRSFPVRADTRLSIRRLCLKTAACALCLTGFDLFLDPVCVEAGLWHWPEPGSYWGTPIANFFGWFLVGCLIYGPYFTLERHMPKPDRSADKTLAIVAASLVLFALTLTTHWLNSVGPALFAATVLAPFWLIWGSEPLRGLLARIGRVRTTVPSFRRDAS